jgi:septum formation protein
VSLDESPRPNESPADYVARLARDKARAAALQEPTSVVLGADTTVAIDRMVLGKPKDAAEAEEMLERLSGRVHSVWTAVALEGAARSLQAVETRVTFRKLGAFERAWYVRSGEPLDKAGAYAIQGLGAMLVESISGSYTNVVGLPLAETLVLLRQAGVSLPWSAA